MNLMIPFLTLQADPETGLLLAQEALTARGLEVLRSFDLQVARTSHSDYTGPHHDNDDCGCQLAVLLVYKPKLPPITLIAQGYDNRTQICLVDSLLNHSDIDLLAAIYKALKHGEYAVRIRWNWTLQLEIKEKYDR